MGVVGLARARRSRGGMRIEEGIKGGVMVGRCSRGGLDGFCLYACRFCLWVLLREFHLFTERKLNLETAVIRI